MKTVFLVMIGLSNFLLAIEVESSQFTKVNNIVIDSKTGLQWQDNSDNNSTKKTWKEAIDYCETLSLDNHDDWRLPNINELKTLIDRTKSNPAIRENIFEYIGLAYWTASSLIVALEKKYAYIINFNNGSVNGGMKSYTNRYYLRCVRDDED